MLDKLSVELNMRADEDNTVLDMIISMCKQIRSNRYKQQNNNAVIGKLRVIFAKISLDKLEPDLVIMDEFQRFKYLINSDSDTETGMLANKFFNSSKVRIKIGVCIGGQMRYRIEKEQVGIYENDKRN